MSSLRGQRVGNRTSMMVTDNGGTKMHVYTYRLVKVKKSGDLPALTLGQALDSPCVYTTGGNANWAPTRTELYYGNSCAASGTLSAQGQSCWLQTTVEGPGTVSTVKFWCKTESSSSSNDLKFYIGDQLTLSGFNGTRDWEEMEFTVTGSGTHTLKWLYTRGSPTSGGNGYVDWVQWSGTQPPAPPEPGPDAWRTLNYVYDAAGRRIAKQYDGVTVLTYVYDGSHCIAEYDAYGNVKRKYIYGPCTDEPISMTETTGSYAGTYYYHFDALGSVVALTNTSGNTVEVYEYDVYGRVGASDASHPNRIMFTGREYDKETGLYYYRARYYNPQIGRFLQTDPIGYEDGMNPYAYCKNNPLVFVDPTGRQAEDAGPPYDPLIDGDARPDYPGHWTSWKEFAQWYCTGGGDAVDLYNVDLLDNFKARVAPQVTAFEDRVIFAAKNHAKKILAGEESVWCGVIEENISYNLAPGVSGKANGFMNGDPLFVLGGGSIHAVAWLTARLVCSQPKMAEWTVSIEYDMCDPFADPLDWFHLITRDIELPGGTPYGITASWTFSQSGTVSEHSSGTGGSW